MEKQSYLKIRQQLNFVPSHPRLALHIVEDIFLGISVLVLQRMHSPPAYILSQLLLAAFFFRSFSVMHDAVHSALSRHEKWNRRLGILYGGFCFLPFTTWRAIHIDHHEWAGNADKDPTMKIVREYPQKSELEKRFLNRVWPSWIPFIALLQEIVFWTVSARFVFSGRMGKENREELAASVAAPLLFALALIASGAAHGSILFNAPAFVTYLVLVEVVNFPHHLRLARVTGERSLPLWEQYKVSRTCLYSPAFARFVLLNFNYHAEHHLFPTLPWYELPKAYSLVRPAAGAAYNMCEGHEWIIENRKLSFADVIAETRSLDAEVAQRRAA